MTLIAGGGEEGRVLPKHLSGRGRLHGRHARGKQVRSLFHLSDKILNFRLFLHSIHSAANETAATVKHRGACVACKSTTEKATVKIGILSFEVSGLELIE